MFEKIQKVQAVCNLINETTKMDINSPEFIMNVMIITPLLTAIVDLQDKMHEYMNCDADWNDLLNN